MMRELPLPPIHTAEPSRADWVLWAAGHLEGEGTFCLRPGGRSVEISVHSVHPANIDRLNDLWPGRVTYETRRNPRIRPCFRWRVYGDMARKCAAEILETGTVLVKAAQVLAVRDSQRYPKGSAMHKGLAEDALRERNAAYNEDRSMRR